MSDDPKKRGKHDRIRINVRQIFERTYWTKALGITQARLREAVAAVGPMVKDVKRYLIERIEKA
jgi:hypothetical protein